MRKKLVYDYIQGIITLNRFHLQRNLGVESAKVEQELLDELDDIWYSMSHEEIAYSEKTLDRLREFF